MHAIEQYLSLVQKPPAPGDRLIECACRENAAWKAALKRDPLLPLPLLPPGYRGREAFQRRKQIFAQLMASTDSPLVH